MFACFHLCLCSRFASSASSSSQIDHLHARHRAHTHTHTILFTIARDAVVSRSSQPTLLLCRWQASARALTCERLGERRVRRLRRSLGAARAVRHLSTRRKPLDRLMRRRAHCIDGRLLSTTTLVTHTYTRAHKQQQQQQSNRETGREYNRCRRWRGSSLDGRCFSRRRRRRRRLSSDAAAVVKVRGGDTHRECVAC